jgi:hypothetical protein
MLIGIQAISEEIPLNFKLEQNYPNPFNPSTKIIFDIPHDNFVSIRIYDLLGREVDALVNERLDAGSYEVDWDASNYPSGVYFYKLTADKYTGTKKMVLLK